MQAARTIRLGMWLIMGLQLLLATGAIAILMRMTPAIADVIDDSRGTLIACEDMLSALAASHDPQMHDRFHAAVIRASTVITTPEQQQALSTIATSAPSALAGDPSHRQRTVEAINDLSALSRRDMKRTSMDAQRLGRAGAWGVVFMALIAFTVSHVILLGLYRQTIEPIEEIRSVLAAHTHGDTLRRCTVSGRPTGVRSLFNDFNQILDRSTNADNKHQ